MDIAKTIERHIVNELLLGRAASVGADQPLIGSGGLLDSLTLLQLISFVEEEFRVAIEDREMTVENFRSIARIQQLIETKTSGGISQ
jgi:acyl carrier protein